MIQSARIVFDSSALLNMYRYPRQARTDLFSVLHSISDRLWMPHQVALEFQENRLAVISDQVSRFKEVKAIISEAESKIKSQFEQLQLDKRHSSIDPGPFIGRVTRVVRDFSEKLETLEKDQPDVYQDDDIWKQLDELYAGKIGSPLSSKTLESLYKEGEERYRRRVPPGYMDQSKEREVYRYQDLMIEKQYGDFILWRQLFEEVQSNKIKSVIFVTDDEKEDW
jgi:hypothetical protein